MPCRAHFTYEFYSHTRMQLYSPANNPPRSLLSPAYVVQSACTIFYGIEAGCRKCHIQKK
eukprot:scaffold159471_cov17-Prasinocladus_malaysianus.AAC.1